MRIATLILGLILGAILFVQTFLVTVLSGAASDRTTSEAGSVGLFMALLWLVGCALVMPIPLVSTVVFAFAGVLGLAAGASSKFTDLTIWGAASFVLAVFSFFGWIGKRNAARRDREAREQMAAQTARLQFATHAALLAAQTNAAGAAANGAPVGAPVAMSANPLPSGSERCPACGAQNPPGSRFCAACGSAVAPAVGGV
jgi:zinc ribbon protein